ncbi:hypothetical protein SRHO_G00308660 [Serrasalmus rhombeus]
MVISKSAFFRGQFWIQILYVTLFSASQVKESSHSQTVNIGDEMETLKLWAFAVHLYHLSYSEFIPKLHTSSFRLQTYLPSYVNEAEFVYNRGVSVVLH